MAAIFLAVFFLNLVSDQIPFLKQLPKLKTELIIPFYVTVFAASFLFYKRAKNKQPKA
ncbi:hypothetical protein K5I29_04370 [Flavobacterium agricola]|uniref:Uncharacterized protein n=1 Tax=Flavobacterium agricola TaxID=2870839 RepID=A0ABY6M2U0_9FLAO|nr:hypothetical protein [Flavobacterium agricola]UYW02142.1 hypothetical protein K5I29_04370 [Flavobacterium agricola]